MPHIPIDRPYPVAWANPVTLRAWAALPAAGAWDATPTEQNVAGAGSILLTFSYTEGAVGGAFNWQLQASPYSVAALVPAGTGEWGDESLHSMGAVVGGADTQSLVQAEYQTFDPTGVAIETFVYGPIELDHTVERVRIPCAESGVVGTPGNCAIVMTVYP
jgi:hypothetical protein